MRISHGPYGRRVRGETRKTFRADTTVAKLYQQVLDRAYEGEESKTKQAAADHGSTPRAAENWFAGDNAPTLEKFLIGYHTNSRLKAWADKLLFMKQDLDADFQAELSQFIRAAQRQPQRSEP